MNRIKCIVSYDGSKFHGFQVQNQFRTVQGEIQKAIKNICKDESIVIHASGRTDAKVHGRRQVFHFDTLREMPEKQWKRAINHFLPNDIYIIDSFLVDENFHSRYSATKKEYNFTRYCLYEEIDLLLPVIFLSIKELISFLTSRIIICQSINKLYLSIWKRIRYRSNEECCKNFYW